MQNVLQKAQAHFQAGQFEQVVQLLDPECADNPNNVDAWFLLGISKGQLGDLVSLVVCMKKVIALMPGHIDAYYWAGRALRFLGRHHDELNVYLGLTKAYPFEVRGWLMLGIGYEVMGDQHSATGCYERALECDPMNENAHVSLANVKHFAGDHTTALYHYDQAYNINPTNLRAALGHFLSLPIIYKDEQAIVHHRDRYLEGLRSISSMKECFHNNPSLIDDLQWPYGFYLAYQGHNDRDLQKLYAHFFEEMVASKFGAMRALLPLRTHKKGCRIRVGFVSHFLHGHTISYYFKSWLLELEKGTFESYLYHIDPKPDAVSQQLEKSVDHYRPLNGPIFPMAQVIQRDELDVLIYLEVGMYTKHSWLAALRLAPVQCAAWGHPVTTGLSTIDYFLSSNLMEPDDAELHYTERLVRLDGLGTGFEQLPLRSYRDRSVLGLPEDRHIYLCPQSLFKIHPSSDSIFVNILAQDTSGLLLFFKNATDFTTAQFTQRLQNKCDQLGVNYEKQIRILPRCDHDEYLSVNQASDIMLDTPYWSGGRTSLDALSIGLPIVTLPGKLARGRQTFAMYQALGMNELIAKSESEYISLVDKLIQQPDWRKDISQRLRVQAPDTLFNTRKGSDSLQTFIVSVATGKVD